MFLDSINAFIVFLFFTLSFWFYFVFLSYLQTCQAWQEKEWVLEHQRDEAASPAVFQPPPPRPPPVAPVAWLKWANLPCFTKDRFHVALLILMFVANTRSYPNIEAAHQNEPWSLIYMWHCLLICFCKCHLPAHDTALMRGMLHPRQSHTRLAQVCSLTQLPGWHLWSETPRKLGRPLPRKTLRRAHWCNKQKHLLHYVWHDHKA